MDVLNYFSCSSYGTISVEHLDPDVLSSQNVGTPGERVSHHVYRWFPPPTLRGEVPQGLFIAFDCYVTRDGVRRFVPADGFGRFITLAFAAGMAIDMNEQSLGKKQRDFRRQMALIFHVVHGMSEHIDREFHFGRDLYIRLSGRESDSERNVLPSDIDVRSTKDLVNCGREMAKASGILRPTMEQSIHLALVDEAKKRPLRVNGKAVLSLVRTALFAPPPGGVPSRKLVNLVNRRISIAIDRHRADSTDKFDRWISGPHNNFIKSIADQPRSQGGTLSRADVRRVILDQGWKSYSYVAKCIQAFTVWFERALPEKLSTAERPLFSHMFKRRSYCGDLPLVLLMERQSFIRSAITDIWSAPDDPNLIGVLHRLLLWYREMVANRREADRRFKANRVGHKSDRKSVQRLGVRDGDVASPVPALPSGLPKIVEHIRASRGLRSRCCCGPFDIAVVSETPLPGRQIVVRCGCDSCEISDEMTISLEKLQQSARELGLDGDESPYA